MAWTWSLIEKNSRYQRKLKEIKEIKAYGECPMTRKTLKTMAWTWSLIKTNSRSYIYSSLIFEYFENNSLDLFVNNCNLKIWCPAIKELVKPLKVIHSDQPSQ